MTKYAQFHHLGLEPPTSSLVRTFLTNILHSHLLWLYRVCHSFILTLKLICRGSWHHHPSYKYFCILSKNSFKSLHKAKQIKKWNFYTIVIMNYRRKKYIRYILVYMKVKIVKISTYDLSYRKYYIVILIRELMIIFWTIKWSSMKRSSATKF